MADPDPMSLTEVDVQNWWGIDSAIECCAAIGTTLGLTNYSDELLREYYYWNLMFCKEANLPASKALIVFHLLRTHHEASVAQGLSLQKSMQLLQRSLFEATKRPPPPPAPDPEPEPAPEPEADGETANDESVAESETETAQAEAEDSVEAEPEPIILGLSDVKLVLVYVLDTYFKHYVLYQAAFRPLDGTAQKREIDVTEKQLRVDLPPSTPNVLLPLSAALTEAEWEAEQHRLAAEAKVAAEAEAARLAAETEAEQAQLLGEDTTADPDAAEAEPEAELEAGTEAEAEPESEPEQVEEGQPDAEEEAGTEAEPEAEPEAPSLAMLLEQVVNAQMKSTRARMEVIMKSREVTMMQKIGDLERKLAEN